MVTSSKFYNRKNFSGQPLLKTRPASSSFLPANARSWSNGNPGYILLKLPTKLTKIWEWVYATLKKIT